MTGRKKFFPVFDQKQNQKEPERTGKNRKEPERTGKNRKEPERTGKNRKRPEKKISFRSKTGKNSHTGLYVKYY
jgi:hypothetical protein